MRKHVFLLFLIYILTGTLAKAQQPDSIYFYKDGAIVYGEAITQIDSLTFLPTNYYDLQRSEAIYDELASHPELSIFTSMILRAGMADKLIYKTIWAPTNEAFQGMDPKELLDSTAAKQLVYNQMCDYFYSTSSVAQWPRKIKMLSGKNFTFSKTDTGYKIGENPLLTSNVRVANSLVHFVNKKNPYRLNIWEYIDKTTDLDSLRTYIRSLNTMKLYHNVFVNNVFKDTISLPQNDLIEYLAKLNNEDSIYTVLLPENEAFRVVYDRLLPYCKSSTGVPLQEEITKWTILRELIFRGNRVLPLSDSIIQSVSGTKYLHPDSLFLNASSTTELSNGMAYRVPNLKIFEPGFQNKTIRIEAEDAVTNKLVANYYDALSITNLNSNFSISNGKYLNCRTTTVSALSQLSISVPIPYSYSMKYNVYFVFAPTYITDTTDLRPYKLDFYIATNGNEVGTYPTYTKINPSFVITNPTTMTKVLVAENYKFESCNIFHDPTTPSRVFFKVRNMGGVSTTELKSYNRNMLIDYILLEPAE